MNQISKLNLKGINSLSQNGGQTLDYSKKSSLTNLTNVNNTEGVKFNAPLSRKGINRLNTDRQLNQINLSNYKNIINEESDNSIELINTKPKLSSLNNQTKLTATTGKRKYTTKLTYFKTKKILNTITSMGSTINSRLTQDNNKQNNGQNSIDTNPVNKNIIKKISLIIDPDINFTEEKLNNPQTARLENRVQINLNLKDEEIKDLKREE